MTSLSAIPPHIQTTHQSSRGNICPIIPAFINSDNMSYLAATCSSAQCVDTQSRGTYEWYGPSFFSFHLFNTLTVSITSPRSRLIQIPLPTVIYAFLQISSTSLSSVGTYYKIWCPYSVLKAIRHFGRRETRRKIWDLQTVSDKTTAE